MKKPVKPARKLVVRPEIIVQLTGLRLQEVAGGKLKPAVFDSGQSNCWGCSD
jgi:hypothetical protein